MQLEPDDNNFREVNPEADWGGTGIIIWDFFAPWWSWTQKEIVGTGQVDKRACVLLRSAPKSTTSKTCQVISCIDPESHLALQTQIFDRQNALQRTITVEKFSHMKGGAKIATKIRITGIDGSMTIAETYSGDEQFDIPRDAFTKFASTILDRHNPYQQEGRQERAGALK